MPTHQPIPHPEVKYTQLFINNEFVDATSGKTFPTINPTTEEIICQVQEAGKADVDKAVEAAKKAFKRGSVYRNLDARERGNLLHKLADLIERDLAYIASLETLDNGKPFASALGDMQICITWLRYHGGWADKILGKLIPADGNKFTYSVPQPVGVVGLITAWNFPLALACIKVAPAIAAGCTCVVKPAEQTPLTALYLGKLIKEAGFPPGVINILSGDGPVAGASISEHPDIHKVSFTGSTEVGRLIQKASGDTNLKRVTMELGGKSPLIICKSANMDEAVEIAQMGCFANMGQNCCALTRTFVHEDVYDEFVKKTRENAKKLSATYGDPFKQETLFGPQVDEIQFKKILGYIQTGIKEGAKLECGGNRKFDKGYFIEPTVFSNVTDEMTIAKEEIFGPVQQVLKFKDIDEAIERANSTSYGLAAGVVTNDLEEAHTVAAALDAGQIWVNTYFPTTCQTPFGGFKESGIGREHGHAGVEEYLEEKTVIMKMSTKLW